MARRSITVPLRDAEMMPMERPKASQMTTPPTASEIVAGRSSRIWSSTSRLVR